MASVEKYGKGWCVRYRMTDELGREKYKRVSGFSTKAEAWEKARELEQLSSSGVDVHGDRLPLGLIVERWFSEYVLTANAETTASKYNNAMELLSTLPFYKEPVRKINAKRFQQIINAVRHVRPGKTLSPITAYTYLDPVRLALSWAAKEGIIPSNPIAGVQKPKQEPTKQDKIILNDRDISDLVTFSRGTSAHIPVLLALYGGLRREEIAGLQWPQVDLQRGTATILRAETQTCEHKRVIKDPKSQASRRTITLPKIVTDALRQVVHTSDYVCAKPCGQPYAIDTYQTFIRRLVDKINKARAGTSIPPMPPASMHDLRHTHVAMLIKMHVQPKVIQERLGHSSIKITMDLYGYLMTGLQDSVADALDAYASGQ